MLYERCENFKTQTFEYRNGYYIDSTYINDGYYRFYLWSKDHEDIKMLINGPINIVEVEHKNEKNGRFYVDDGDLEFWMRTIMENYNWIKDYEELVEKVG